MAGGEAPEVFELAKATLDAIVLFVVTSCGMIILRVLFDEITAVAPIPAMIARRALLSQALSVSTASPLWPLSSAGAWVMSPTCPAVTMKRSGWPSASASIWIVVVSPPRERPNA